MQPDTLLIVLIRFSGVAAIALNVMALAAIEGLCPLKDDKFKRLSFYNE
mgnify:CR=1 FL=1